MERYDYLEAVKADVEQYIKDNINPKEFRHADELSEYLYNVCLYEDSVTGNGSGSYTFSTWEAEENICHNLSLLSDALEEFGYSKTYLLEEGAEKCDVIMRCYFLADAIAEVLNEIDLGLDLDDYDEIVSKQYYFSILIQDSELIEEIDDLDDEEVCKYVVDTMCGVGFEEDEDNFTDYKPYINKGSDTVVDSYGEFTLLRNGSVFGCYMLYRPATKEENEWLNS